MKKIIIYSLMLLTSVGFYSCSDKDENFGADVNREFMPMFRCDNNTGKGSTDPYNCHTIAPNSAYLCWYTVDNCVGYEIRWGILAGSQGEAAWQRVIDAGTVGDTVVTDPNQYTLTVKHLQYGSTYSFAIRALHSFSKNEKGEYNDPLNSKWYGYGDSRQWADYMNLDMEDRYPTPTIIGAQFLEDKDDPNYKTSFRVYLDRSTSSYSADELETFTTYTLEKPNGQSMTFFQTQDVNGEKVFKVDYLEVAANPSSPDAHVPEQFRHYKLTQEDWDRGYVYVYGLDENSVYNVNVYDEDIPYAADASYNGVVKRTKGDPGPPILIPHVAQATDTMTVDNVDYIIDISSYNACKLNGWFANHMTSNTIAENQVYYLEGGKNYFIDASIELYKGFTLATNPADLAAGKGKAKIFMSGLGRYNSNHNVFSCNFAFGRGAQAGESASVPLEIDTIKFQNIDFSVPLAYNKGDNNIDPNNAVTANYWFNDINSNAMGYILNYFEVSGCSFQGFQRGWMRTKTTHAKIFKHFYIYGNEFYNMGFYDNNGGGYGYMSFKGGSEKGSNPYVNCELINNTFYDSPCMYLIGNDAESLATWTDDQAYNITIKNNTFVNFNTLNKNGCLFNPKSGKGAPRGSKFTIQNNLIIVAYDENDAGRAATHYCAGWRVEEMKGVTDAKFEFNISNNWSTSEHISTSTGEVLTDYQFSRTGSGGIAYWVGEGALLNGGEEKTSNNLKVHYEEGITTSVLMRNAIPSHSYSSISTAGPETFRIDNLDGLYYNDTEAVRNSQIFKLGIGASKWRSHLTK